MQQTDYCATNPFDVETQLVQECVGGVVLEVGPRDTKNARRRKRAAQLLGSSAYCRHHEGASTTVTSAVFDSYDSFVMHGIIDHRRIRREYPDVVERHIGAIGSQSS
jgi:hypothetical protein